MAVVLELTQANRLLRITTPLGADALILRHLSVTEALRQPFTIAAEVISSRDDLKPVDLIGKTITCAVHVAEAPVRHFNGMVRAFARIGGQERGLTHYRLEAVPRLSNMGRTADCRIFQDKSVKDILEKIFFESHVSPVQWGLATGPRPYCVQFNETDLDFAHRLMDEIGASYFFTHAEGSHTLVVGENLASHPLLPGEPMVVRSEPDRPGAIARWEPHSTLPPGKHHTLDFDGIKPSRLLTTNATSVQPYPSPTDWEIFHWPGGQGARPDIDPARLGMEQDEAQADEIHAVSRNPALHAGARLRVKPELGGSPATWLLVAVHHEAVDETHLGQDGTTDYSNSMTLVSADRPWRNPHPRPRAQMPAVQSAIVTGPSGEEIHTDQYGRVKVHFHWDRAGEKNDTSSCWMRVAQPFAGAWGGTWFLPRIGDEVLVAFLDGDADRPVVIGSVYNSDGKPPWALPAHKTRSGIRSRSTKSGARDNANIIGFDDKKGSEELYFQAEKDHRLLVKNDRTDDVKHDRTTTIYNADTLTVKDADRTVTLEKGNLVTTIQKGNETRTIDTGNRETTIAKGNETLTVSMGNRETTIKTGNDKLTVSMGNLAIEVSLGNITIKAGVGAVTIEALQGITLKGGPTSTLEVKPDGITLSCLKLTTDAKLLHDNKGLIKQHAGQGMAKFGGAITMIGA